MDVAGAVHFPVGNRFSHHLLSTALKKEIYNFHVFAA